MTGAWHTPTPWTFTTVKTSCGFVHKIGPFPWNERSNHACIYVDDDWSWKYGEELYANAALIVRAVNSHAEMLAALKDARLRLYMMARSPVSNASLSDEQREAFAIEACSTIDTAIANAERERVT